MNSIALRMLLPCASADLPRPRLSVLTLCLAAALAPLSASAELAADDATQLDRVVVTGTSSGPYAPGEATSATGLALEPRETPQSVSTIGRAQIEDFGLDSLNEALESTTGISVERVETGRTYYTARGFDIVEFQRDGLGMPLPYGVQTGDVDTALFERIEVLRGANGLMTATGNPSATVNFVRKRPTATTQGHVRGTFGSWDRARLEGDVSGPLNEAGTIRARAVGAWDQSDSYLDRHSLEKYVAYGVIEADLGQSTLLTAGVSRQRNDADSPLWGALPLYYTDGTPTSFDRSTSTAADWSFWDTEDTRSFVEVAHQFGHDWELRAAFNHEESTQDAELFYVFGTPDRTTGEGLKAFPSAYAAEFDSHQADVRVTGPLQLGGRSHDLVVGAARAEGRLQDASRFGGGIGAAVPPLETWDGDFPKPAFGAPSAGSDFDYRRDSLYATVRWNIADTVKLITGANRAEVRTSGTSYGISRDASASDTTPFVGALWDFAPHSTVYASYAEIFAQQQQLDAAGDFVGDLRGSNAEVGIKSEWFDGRLNTSFTVFRVRQENFAERGPFDFATGRFVHVGVDAESEGFEFDVAGNIGENWSVAGGYTRLEIENQQGEPTLTYVPRSMLRLSTVWTAPRIDGLRLGASLRWQDEIERTQSLVLPDGQPVVTRQDGYAVLGLMAGYRIGNGWDAQLNVDNVTDEKYISSLYWKDQGFYGAPRNVSLSIGYRF